ncbi:MAG: metal ABC transporter substrate-binding protein [Puniceicoccales bacterium]|jgi:ABC-type Zn uptake system ZnuABC Zn-binding protein ZnuA|nr:metal ABC transporter substrate-binding protein [Puniceicoccales bacterium]
MKLPLLMIYWSALFFAVGATLQAATLRVVTSFTIPADWAREVGGGRVVVEAIVPPGADFHAYQPTPSDMRKLHAADLVIAIDPDLEAWLSKLVRSDVLRRKTLYLGQEQLFRENGGRRYTHTHPHVATASRENSSRAAETLPDPHLWMDPLLVVDMATRLSARLTQIDPQSSAAYAAATARYTAALRDLDGWARRTLASVPPERRVLLAHHDNLRRLGARYDLRCAATLLSGVSTEALDPTAGEVAKFIRLARQLKVPVFYDNTGGTTLVNTVTREAGLPPPVMLYTDALPSTPAEFSSYLGMYRENIRRIAGALRP